MTDASRPLHGLRLLFGAETFPNRIQPWVLSWIVESIRNGAEASVCAYARLGSTHQTAIDALGLDRLTTYVQPSTLKGVVRGLTGVLKSSGFQGLARGLSRARAASLNSSSRLKLAARNIALLPVLGGPRPDLIHSHAMNMTYTLVPVARALGVPLVATFHGLPPKGVPLLPPRMQADVFSTCAMFMVNTAFAQKQLESLGCPRHKIRVIPQGIDLDEFTFQPTRPDLSRTIRLLTVARLHEDKGHKYMIEAVALLRRAGHDVTYDIVGVGPLTATLPRVATEAGVADCVRFHGEVDDPTLRNLYRSASVFVLPSVRSDDGFHEETQGVVLQEAQASGLLTIATRTGGIPECVDIDHGAWLVPDRDASALAAAVTSILNQPQRWEDLQRAGRKWVEDHFDIRTLGRRMASLYLEAKSEYRTGSGT